MLDGGRAVIWMREVVDAADANVVIDAEVDVVRVLLVVIVVGAAVVEGIGTVGGDGVTDGGSESMARDGSGVLVTGGV